MLEFRVLGPLEVLRDGRLVDVRGSKRRAVLALLILQANEIVRTDRLIEDLWGERRPGNAPAALHNHVSRLRKDLGESVVVTKPWGYVLRADPETVDLERFESLVTEARPLPARERNERLGAALALWRGPALADLVNEPALAGEIGRLEELREVVIEQRIDAQLELGEHNDAIRVLEGLIAAHPLRERLRGQLILALYRAGRQAEALETYRETRRVLVEELGIEPSPELRELERAILRQDPALASARVPSEPESPRSEPPPASRWRWPRSPLIVGAAALVALAGLAVAILVTPRSATQRASAAPTSAPGSLTTTPGSISSTRPTAATTTKPRKESSAHKNQRSRPRPRPARPRLQAPVKAAPTRQAGDPEAARPAPRPVRPAKPKPAPKPAPRPAPYRATDDFEDPVTSDFWRGTGGSGVEVAERNGQLQFTFDAGASAEGEGWFGATYESRCRFQGDFDLTLDYELLQWRPANGVSLQATAWFGTQGLTIARQSLTWGEQYNSWKRRMGGAVPTADTKGAFRLRRKNGELFSYHRENGKWSVLLALVFGSEPVTIMLQAGSTNTFFADQAVTAAFDNFTLTAPARPFC